MFKVTRRIQFCYGHRLLQYEGKCRNLHGHNGIVEIDFAAPELDREGMVLDFGSIKQIVSTWIEQNLDHCMVLCRDDPAVKVLRDIGERVYELDTNPTAENIAKLIYDYAAGQGLPVTEVRLWESPNCYATYRADT